jgi:cell division transport system permease protein
MSNMPLKFLRRRLRAWSRRQLYSFFSSLGTLLGHRLATTMTVLVLGIAMALPLGLYLAVQNLSGLDLQQDEWGAITVFLHKDISEKGAAGLARMIDDRPDASAETLSPQQGMDEFRQASGFGPVLDLFDENPLPWVLLVTPQPQDTEELGVVVATLDAWLQTQDAVDIVQVDHKWLQRLAGLLELGEALVTVLSVMFSLAVFVVVANTIRLDVANRSEEIQVLSLVGAGDSFIRQPFLYSGFWYGLLGALFALVLLSISALYLQQPLDDLLDAYGSSPDFKGLGSAHAALVLLGGGVLGLLGAWVSVQRYLRQMRLSGMLGRM